MALSDYHILGGLGDGAFGMVHRCEHRATKNKYALKRLRRQLLGNQEAVRRFRREVECLRALSGQPHIMPIIESGDEGEPYYVMPLAVWNLADFIRSNNTSLSPKTRAAIYRAILDALEAAHGREILHRDLAPANVLISGEAGEPCVHVADFGLGRDLTRASSLTQSRGEGAGHILYIAPEQRESLASATTLSDIFALGRLLKFVMTGRDPDAAFDSPYNHVVAVATHRKPDKRYRSVAALRDAFEEAHGLATGLGSAAPDEALRALRDTGRCDGWPQFHAAATRGRLPGHVFSEYLDPVTSYLSAVGALAEYEAAVGAEIEEFLEVYQARLLECTRSTGWPFTAMTWFGSFLDQVFHEVETLGARKLALEMLWHLAFEIDQWSVQRIVRGVLKEGAIGSGADLDQALAAYVLECEAPTRPEDLEGVVLPQLTALALERVWRQSSRLS